MTQLAARPVSAAALLPGAAAVACMIGLIGLPILTLAVAAPDGRIVETLGDPYVRHVAWFGLWQAALSMVLSLALAVPVAGALTRRRRLIGVAILLRMFNLALVAPAMIAILGIAAIHGRSGWVNQLLGVAGFEGSHYLYGLPGILLAHVFFNMPLATRVFLQAIEGVPPENWHLGSQFSMGPGAIFG
jgi:thiamine transport system permease protein